MPSERTLPLLAIGLSFIFQATCHISSHYLGSNASAPQPLIYRDWIVPNDPRPYQQFGQTISTNKENIVFIASGINTTPRSKVVAYAVQWLNASAQFQPIAQLESLKDPASDNDGYGWAIESLDSLAVISAPFDNAPMFQSGKVYVYDLRPLSMRPAPPLPPLILQSPQISSAQSSTYKERFGFSLSLVRGKNQYFLAIGAPGYSSGSVYLFAASISSPPPPL